MQEGPSNLPVSESGRPAGYPKDRFTILLLVLVGLLVGLALLQRIDTTRTPAVSEQSLQADLMARMSYAYRGSRLLGPVAGRQAGEIERRAVQQYARLVRENPNPSAIRRLLILQHDVGDPALSGSIDLLREAARRSDIEAGKRRELLSEAEMWRQVYLGEAADAGRYSRLVRRLDLGWYERVALSHLYERAGMAEKAAEERRAALHSAMVTFVWLLSLAVLVFVLGAIGLGLLVAYAIRKPRHVPPTSALVSETDSITRGVVAGYMLETFVAYLAIVIGTQAAAGVVLGVTPLFYSKPGAAEAVGATLVTYVLAGVLAVAYLSFRLRLAGWSWELIGLKTRTPWRDVLWGVGGYGAALPLIVTAAILSSVVTRFVPTPPNPVVPLFVEAKAGAARLMLVGLALVAAPFFEEIFFRGVLYNCFRAKWGATAGIVGSAVVFAAVHPLPLGFLPIFALGAVFATLLHERGSLLPSMVAHSLNNGVALLLLFILVGPA